MYSHEVIKEFIDQFFVLEYLWKVEMIICICFRDEM